MLREGTERYEVTLYGNYDPENLLLLNVSLFLQSFVMENVYYEIYTVQLAYQQKYVDHSGMVTTKNVVRQISSPLVPRVLYTINRELDFYSFLIYFISTYLTVLPLQKQRLWKKSSPFIWAMYPLMWNWCPWT